MTSTHTFTGLDTDSKSSSRVLRPPGGGSSCIFGGPDDTPAPSRQHKMSSNIFGSAPEPQSSPKRSNPPGGKPSGIFEDPAPAQAAQKNNPPGGKTSDIFGDSVVTASPKPHPNKPKDNISLKQSTDSKNNTPVKADPPAAAPKAEPIPIAKEVKPPMPDPALAAHEPHLGPRPRSHNRVLNPPGGKSSVTFY
ncbi:jupiter microtubule associated homolog 2 [Discoglossus pictus]